MSSANLEEKQSPLLPTLCCPELKSVLRLQIYYIEMPKSNIRGYIFTNPKR